VVLGFLPGILVHGHEVGELTNDGLTNLLVGYVLAVGGILCLKVLLLKIPQ
jgi:hypothetical protein